jgi:uncharacterized protein YaaR (DUF327 family)
MMQINKVIELIVKEIDEKVIQLQEHLGSGGAIDFTEYNRVCGEIKGLLTIRRYTIDLNKNLENSDD